VNNAGLASVLTSRLHQRSYAAALSFGCQAAGVQQLGKRGGVVMPSHIWPRRLVVWLAVPFGCLLLSAAALAEERAPSGRAVMAWHVTIAPSWFDPSSAPPQITPFGMLYAIHDALVRPYPGQKMGPSLAETWSESEDGLTYEFKLRPNLKFHNGDPLTTDDVKFSFDRYHGAAAKTLHEHVTQVEIVDPRVVRFHLDTP
jgi:ABC-type transport system substrate-binding protein